MKKLRILLLNTVYFFIITGSLANADNPVKNSTKFYNAERYTHCEVTQSTVVRVGASEKEQVCVYELKNDPKNYNVKNDPKNYKPGKDYKKAFNYARNKASSSFKDTLDKVQAKYKQLTFKQISNSLTDVEWSIKKHSCGNGSSVNIRKISDQLVVRTDPVDFLISRRFLIENIPNSLNISCKDLENELKP